MEPPKSNDAAGDPPGDSQAPPPGGDRPLGGGGGNDDMAIGGKAGNNPFGNLEDNGVDLDNTLEGRLKSGDAKVRVKAYEELVSWSDPDYTPTIFAKGLHLTVKEKDSNVIDKILTAIESIMEKHPSDYAAIDMKKFLPNFTEFLLNNVKGAAKDHANAFVVKLWEKAENKNELLERIKEMIATVKMKLQEKALGVVLELLKAGKMEEMQLLKPLYPELEKQLVSRTAAIKTAAFEVYKEAFLWIGEGIKAFITGLKEAQAKDMEAYMKSVDPKNMKSLRKDDGSGKGKKFDIYETITEAELPKQYNEDEFADSVMALTKWKERKEKLDELTKVLEKTPKLSQKTNAFIYMNLAKRIFMESNIAVQVSIIRVLGFLAAGMRKGFLVVGKTMFPVLVGKLKEKNRQLSEEILSTLEKFYLALTFEETADEIEEALKDKNPEKKINVLNLLFILNDKADKIKTQANSVRVVKIVSKLLDENDSGIREKASELVAKQLDQYEEKINPLLKDLPAQKMAKIMKYRQKMSTIPLDDPAKATEKVDDKNAKKDADDEPINKKRNMSDKAQMIAKLREEVFSNRRVRLTDVRQFSMYLYSSLSQLIELTKEFKEITASQATEIFLFIDEIIQKVEKQAFQEDSRKIIAQFYIEQLLGKASDELMQSLERYKNCSSRIMVPRLFLQDMLNVLNKKQVKLSKELLSEILTLYENEVQATNKLANIPHSLFVEFLKINFSVPNIHVSMKQPLIQTMRILSTKFGERATNDFPQVLFKELNTQNTDLQKTFEKTYEKLVSQDPEKNKQAIQELRSCDDHSKISFFWSKPEFVGFLRNQLNSDGRVYTFGDVCKIVSNYLVTKQESPIDFKIKHYLAVFQTILAIHYGPENEAKKSETEKIVNQTVESLSAPTIMNEMISDTVLSQNKMQILNFFFQFSSFIEPSVKFINYLSNIIDPRGIQPEMQRLLDLVLLVIKNANDDEVVLRGCENRYIRDVWQKHEIDLLINEDLVRGSKVFEDQTTFNMLKNFLLANLRIEDMDFHSYDLESLSFGAKDVPLKARLAYFYLRSVENIRKNCIYLLNQVPAWLKVISNREESLIACKTTFNVLRNIVYMQGQDTFRRGRDMFVEMVGRFINPNEGGRIFELNEQDNRFYFQLLRRQEVRFAVGESQPEEESMNEPSFMNQPQYIQGGARAGKGEFDKPKVNQLRIEEPYLQSAVKAPESPIGKNTSKKRPGQPELNTNRPPARANTIAPEYPGMNSNDVSYIMTVAMLEKPELLQTQFDRMMTFDLGEFQEASRYFQELCRANSPTSVEFLCSYSNEIVDTFVTVSATIFQEGINYDLDRPSYELIFVPLQLLFNVQEFLLSLQHPTMTRLVNHVVFRLVCSNEEKNEFMQQGDEEKVILDEFIIKFWNSLMLRIIDRSDTNALIQALFTTVMELQVSTGDPVEVGVFNLSMRCLSKILKNFKNTIRSVNVPVVFGHIHNYVSIYGLKDAESLGSKTVKSLINELVANSDFQDIWNAYYKAFGKEGENVIVKWIRLAQNKMVESKMVEMIQACESRGSDSAALELVDFFLQMREMTPGLDLGNFSGYFQDPGFFDVVMNEIPPPEYEQSAFSKNKGNVVNKSVKGKESTISRAKPKPEPPARPGQRSANTKKSVDRFKKNGNMDQYLDRSEISNYSEMGDYRETNARRGRR